MNRSLALLIFMFVSFTQASACLNGETKYLKDGTFLFEDRDSKVPEGHGNLGEDYLLERTLALDSIYKATNDLDYLSDKGLLMILQKKYQEAIALYLNLEQIDPNRYSTASNIGTAYELDGQNENALKWIAKAVSLDPKSHKGSEWIHVKILEAKLKGASVYNSRFLINTDFGSNLLPKTTLSENELTHLADGLYYQLNERMTFVIPEDKIVAQLLFDLGNVAFLNGQYTDAVGDYDAAKTYGFKGSLIDNRIREATRFSKLSRVVAGSLVRTGVQTNYLLFLAAGVIALCFTATISLWRKRRKLV